MGHTYACLISHVCMTQHAEGLWHVAKYLDHVCLTPRCSDETRTHLYYYIVICGDMCAIFKTCFLALILCGKHLTVCCVTLHNQNKSNFAYSQVSMHQLLLIMKQLTYRKLSVIVPV